MLERRSLSSGGRGSEEGAEFRGGGRGDRRARASKGGRIRGGGEVWVSGLCGDPSKVSPASPPTVPTTTPAGPSPPSGGLLPGSR